MQTAQITGPVLTLFTDDGSSGCRAIADPEPVLVQWLIEQPIARNVMLQELRRAQASITKTSIGAPLIENPNSKPGDIDLLVCSPSLPHEALVVEWKRVKVKPIEDGNNRVNKLDALGDGVKQANALRELGFYQTYFGVLTVVDSEDQTNWNVPSRGIDDTATSNYTEANTFKTIVEFPRREELHQDIGIIFIELVQPTRRTLNDLFTVRLCVHHRSTPQMQRSSATNRFVAYLRNVNTRASA